MKVKSLIALLLSGVMILTMTAGCGNKAENESAGSTTSIQTQQSETSKKEIYDVSVAIWEIPSELHAETAQKIKDMFGITIKPVTIGWGDWEEKIKMLISSGDVPDIFPGNGWSNQAEFTKLIEDEVIRSIPDGTIEKYPNVKNVLGQVDAERWQDGKFYHFPRLDTFNINDSGDAGVLIYRKDWAKKLGIAEPTTIDELYSMMTAFAKNDPDGNGKNDTYGITCSTGWAVSAFVTMFGNKSWMEKGDKFVPYYISDKSKEAVSWLKKIYDEKILDPEFQILTNEQRNEKFALGKAGVTIANADLSNIYPLREALKSINPSLNVEESVDVIALPTASDGSKTWAPKAYWSVSHFSNKIDDAKMERILELYNWLSGDEAFEYLRFGVQDRDYKKVDGKYETLLKDAKGNKTTFDMLNTVYPIRFLALWNADKVASSADVYNDWDKAKDKKVKDTYFANDYKKLLWVNNIYCPVKYEKTVTPKDEFVKLIMQSKDFEADWKNYTETVMKQKDFDKYVDYMNKELKSKNYSSK